MLPKDAEQHHKNTHAENQQRLDPHLREKPPQEVTIPYTDELFRDAAVEWLVSTDQVRNNGYSSLVLLSHAHYSLFKHLNTRHFKI
jgi:hypothetical protein